MSLTDSELTILESLSDTTQAISQRELARRTGLSVGLINAVLKKLVKTGYVKTGNLNRRSIQYLLTPQGFAEKAHKSYQYILNTLRDFWRLNRQLQQLIAQLLEDGVTNVYLHGDGEAAELLAQLLKEDGRLAVHQGIPRSCESSGAVLNVGHDALNLGRMRTINLFHELTGSTVAEGRP